MDRTRRRRPPAIAFLFAAACLAMGASALASAPTTGSVVGVVTDQGGGRVAGARVAIVAGANLEVRSTLTDAEGRFSLDKVQPATYTLVVSKAGFDEHRQSVSIDAAASASVDVALDVAGVAEWVTVTPLRGTAEDVRTTPQFVTVTGADEINRRDNAIFPRALAGDTGVHVQQTSTSQGSPFVRGLTGQQVVALVDGVRFNNSTFRPGANQYTALIDPAFAERVEVVHGPNGAQYGSDSLGGTINVVTGSLTLGRNQPRVGGSASLTFGSADVSAASVVNLAVTGEKWGVRLEGSGRRAQDLRTGAAVDSHSVATRLLGLPSSVLGDRLNDTAFTQYGVLTKLSVHPTTSDFLTMQYMRGAQLGARRYDQLDGGVGNLVNSFDPQGLDFATVRYDRVARKLFDTASLSFSYNAQRDDRTYQSVNNTKLGLRSPISEERNKTTVYGWQAQGGRLARSHSIGAGAEWYDEFVDSTRVDMGYSQATGDFTVPTAVRGRFPNGARYRSVAAYVQDKFPLFSSRLSGTFAVRYSHFRYSQDAGDNIIGTTPTLPTYETSFGDATFNTGIVFALTREVVLTGGVSRGFRAPNVNDYGSIGLSGIGFEVSPDEGMRLGASVGPIGVASPPASQRWKVEPLKPERLLNFEGGVKVNWRRVSGSAVIFDSEIRDLIERRVLLLNAGAVGTVVGGQAVIKQDASGAVYTALSSSTVFVRTNAGRVRLRGGDARVTIKVSPTVTIDANVSSVYGEDLATGLPPGLENGIPPTHGFAGVRWEPRGARWWIEGYTRYAATQSRLSANDLEQARIGGTRTQAEISNFFNNGAVARQLVKGGVLVATGETLPQVLSRVLGPDITARVPFMTENPGFATLNARGGVRLRRGSSVSVVIENILDRNYRVMGSGVDGPGANVIVRYAARF